MDIICFSLYLFGGITMNENMVLFLNVLISFFAVIGIVCFFGCIFNTVYEMRNKRKSRAVLIADLDEISTKQAVKEAEYLFCSMYGDQIFRNREKLRSSFSHMLRQDLPNERAC